MKLFCVMAITLFFSIWAGAQPVEFVKGDSVTVVMGSGTEVRPGTKLRGTVTRYNKEGLGLRVAKHGTYWIKWSHIRSVNGVRLAPVRSGGAPAADDAPTKKASSFAAAPAAALDATPVFDPSPRSVPEPHQASASDTFDWGAPERRNGDAAPVSHASSRGIRRFDDDVPERGWKIAAALDYLGAGNVDSGQLNGFARDICVAVIAGDGATSCTATWSANGAVGFRGGFWRPAENLDWGGSLGYLYGGPSGSGQLTVKTVPAGSGTLTQSDQTVRLLGEVRKTIPLSDPWKFRMGAGMGLAVDFWEASCSSSGIMAGDCNAMGLQSPQSGSLGWFTWELSPAIAYGRWSMGLRYVGFARGGYVPWNTFGGFFGAEF